jgi:hypothetical protein
MIDYETKGADVWRIAKKPAQVFGRRFVFVPQAWHRFVDGPVPVSFTDYFPVQHRKPYSATALPSAFRT